MNKIQVLGQKKTQRKQRTAAVALPQLSASKIPHLKGSQAGSIPLRPVARRAWGCS
jgi:hypothetical protein